MVAESSGSDPLRVRLSQRGFLEIDDRPDGMIFDPSPDSDLDSTGIDDELLSVARVPWTSSGTSSDYDEAIQARVLVAKFKVLRNRFSVIPSQDEASLRRIASGKRNLYQLEWRRFRVETGVSIILQALVGIIVTANIAIAIYRVFGSLLALILIVPTFYAAWRLCHSGSVYMYRERRVILFIAALFFGPFIIASVEYNALIVDYYRSKQEWRALYQLIVSSLSLYYVGIEIALVCEGPAKRTIRRRLGRLWIGEDELLAQIVEATFATINIPHKRRAVRQIALAAEYAANLHEQQSLLDRDEQSRQVIRTRGGKIAATIRRHGTLLLMPGSSRVPVAKSLFNGALSIQLGMWDNLAQIDPDTSVKSTIRRYAPRVTLAMLITTAAIVLPAINGLIPEDQQGYVRSYLLVAAFFTLFVADASKLRDTALGLTKDAMGKSERG